MSKDTFYLKVLGELTSLVNENEIVIIMIIVILIYFQIKILKLKCENRELNNRIEKLQRENILEEEKFKKLDGLKNEFISLISHEFRTPLTSIMGFTKIIKKKLLKYIIPVLEDIEELKNDERLNYHKDLIKGNLEIIISESERLSEMIENVLDITKIESGNKVFKSSKLNIDTIINKAILATYSLIGEKNVEVLDSVETNMPFIRGDEDKIIQILINLLSNALKFTEEGLIVVSAKKKDENYILVEVSDSGIGIPEKYQKLIFEKFKQVETEGGNKPKGTGLGLFITKNFVELHGGTIGVRSNELKGSCFYFTLPIYKGET